MVLLIPSLLGGRYIVAATIGLAAQLIYSSSSNPAASGHKLLHTCTDTMRWDSMVAVESIQQYASKRQS
jgi:hypothetical protein